MSREPGWRVDDARYVVVTPTPMIHRARNPYHPDVRRDQGTALLVFNSNSNSCVGDARYVVVRSLTVAALIGPGHGGVLLGYAVRGRPVLGLGRTLTHGGRGPTLFVCTSSRRQGVAICTAACWFLAYLPL